MSLGVGQCPLALSLAFDQDSSTDDCLTLGVLYGPCEGDLTILSLCHGGLYRRGIGIF